MYVLTKYKLILVLDPRMLQLIVLHHQAQIVGLKRTMCATHSEPFLLDATEARIGVVLGPFSFVDSFDMVSNG